MILYLTMPKENVSDKIREIKTQDYEYISCDPDENADNFDPKWAPFKELRTDEERYRAIRKRWGNANFPNPQINLTCRQMNDQSESETKTNVTMPSTSSKAKTNLTMPSTSSETISVSTQSPAKRAGRRRKRSRYRSRSCTRPYEELISNLEKNYQLEYFHLMYRHEAQLQDMLQFHLMESKTLNNNFYNFGRDQGQRLHFIQEQEVIHLLSNQYKEVQCFIGAKNENIDVCKKYLEEVEAFFTFYQKINDKVTLQMTDEQHEHTVETERMYDLYKKFYN